MNFQKKSRVQVGAFCLICVLAFVIPAESEEQAHSEIPSRLYNLELTSRSNGDETTSERTTSQTVQPKSLLQPTQRLTGQGEGVRLKEKEAKRVAKTNSNYNSNAPNCGSKKNKCEGACISATACEEYGGVAHGQCVNSGVCCKFLKTCRGVTSKMISFFQSPNYPHMSNGSVECPFTLQPQPDVCAVRIDVLDITLAKSVLVSTSPVTYKCYTDSLFILNTKTGPNEALCDLANYTGVFYIETDTLIPIKLLFVMQSKVWKWRIKVTQINCTATKPWTNMPECGRQLMYDPSSINEEDTANSLNTLIVNGQNADGREFPWQVSIQGPTGHRCGASVLNHRFILTAAHCFTSDVRLDQFKVVLGDVNSTLGGEAIGIERIIHNYEYRSFISHTNDIALIKLKKRITFSSNVQPICLAEPDLVLDAGEGVVSGWGRLNGSSASEHDKVMPLHLQKLKVRFISNTECSEWMRSDISLMIHRKVASHRIVDSQICAVAHTTSTVCFGDSGGPLVTQNEEDGRYTQVGIVSYGLGSCIVTRIIPVVYTRVSAFLQFISIVTDAECCE